MTNDYLEVEDAASVQWEASADLVVVGFGGAGVAAAIEARERGASVIAIDRFEGGGATARSGAVTYAGATRFQREAGFEDTPEAMFNYLEAEGVPVKRETLRRFCEGSNADIEWLGAHGVPYSGPAYLKKTTLPPDGYYLYYSGSEKHPKFSAIAKAAPRGHRPATKGFGGNLYFSRLRDSALAAGVQLRKHSPVKRLVVDRTGRVLGVEINAIPASAWQEHNKLYDRVKVWSPFSGGAAEDAIAKAAVLERQFNDRRFIRANGGVLLSTGGFAYNIGMLRQFRPELATAYRSIVRIGSMGCDGSGIVMGQSVGGSVEYMHNMCVGRGIAPPSPLLHGLLVNGNGERFINEDIYTCTMGDAISRQPEIGRAWLIVTARDFWASIRWSLAPDKGMFMPFGLPALLNLLGGGTKRAGSIKALAAKCRIDLGSLERSITDYNSAAVAGVDPLGKASEYLKPVGTGPFYAINMALTNGCAFTPTFTLGGLRVDEESGAVLRADGKPVAGLYSAGRTAVGLCSISYMSSGMSISDTVFSGRRVGRAVAGALAQTKARPTSMSEPPVALRAVKN